ncbi:MAG: hypothetical protein K2N51_02415 [Lachnospiraceae bacterium]|nr:hypothetical protein [Lachnospiraceae bacterium]
MKQDFLKTIGNCKPHESIYDENISTEKIYNNVLEKIYFAKKRRKKKLLFGFVGGLATTAAIFFLFLSSWKFMDGKNQTAQIETTNNDSLEKNQTMQILTTDNGSLKKKYDAKVVFCVYEAKQKEQVITANYMDSMEKREVEDEKEIVLGTYNPLSSAVPGYPIIVSDSKDSDVNVNISIFASQGQLLQWNQETGHVTELGQSGTFKNGERIFWSPLNNGKLVKEAKIEAKLFVSDELESTVNVKIVEETEGVYTAKRIK